MLMIASTLLGLAMMVAWLVPLALGLWLFSEKPRMADLAGTIVIAWAGSTCGLAYYLGRYLLGR